MKSLKSKLAVLGIIPVLVLLALVVFVFLPSIKADIMKEKQSQTEELIDAGISLLEYYHSLEMNNEMTRAEAQDAAKGAIRNLKYGTDQQDYFWINDLNQIIIVHPFRSELEGNAEQDPDGIALLAEFVRIAKEEGKGCIFYQWQYYDEIDRIEPKLACVALFEPWEWVIGTGIYVNDVDIMISEKTQQIFLATLGVLVLAFFTYMLLGNHILIKPINKLIDYGKSLSTGVFSERVQMNYQDELGQLGDSMNKMSSDVEQLFNRLSDQKQHFEALFNNTSDAVVYFDTEFRIYDANFQFTKTFGYSLEEVTGMDINQATGNDDLRVYNNQNQFNLKLPVSHEGTAVKKNGQKIIVLIVSAPVIIDGKLVGGYAIYSDITERKNAEIKLQENYQELESTYEELAASEEELKSQFDELQEITDSLHISQFALDNSSDAVFWIERSGSFAYANLAACELLGYLSKEVLEKSVFDIDPNISKRNWDKHWNYTKKKRKVRFETLHKKKNGIIYPVEIFSTYLNYGNEEYIFSFVTDITKRKNTEAEIELQKRRYEALFLDSMDALVFIGEGKNILEINKKYTELFGYSLEEAKGSRSSDLLSSGDEKHKEEFMEMYEQITNGKTYELETVRYSKSGKPIDVYLKGIPVIIDDKFVGCYVIYTDITERKRYEDNLKHISLHDSLTGLYNRVYFEEEIKKLDGARNYPVSMISADLDGLKLINDTMGHDKGDKLLNAAARVLERSLRKADIIARIGGDEFSVILPNTEEEVADEIIGRIKREIEKYNLRNLKIPLSISLGVATTSGPEKSLNEVLKSADDLMYKDKLYRSSSVRSQIVNSLLAALSERDYIADGHASRMLKLSHELGERVGLTTRQLIDLNLLAQVHDLGKVGIPDNILFKEARLTVKEWEIMQQHPEKGYRIAQSSPDLSVIADLILKHHEKWDGTGYPLGLKGEEIPIECRIMAIVDAFDAMTNNRPYRKAMSKADALMELEKQAGKQFDPHLVAEFIGSGLTN
ncbi:MAG: hypothetical protein APF76_17125 [Desulfitibacter sp. BRH_c19]|nr:MAG: hypothetical protein APF76_17125 [Desulfitibacter sp. BRH_c19]